MKAYTWGTNGEDDFLLLQWWMTMRDAGELETVFGSGGQIVSKWLASWQKGDLVLDVDERGVFFAAWCEQQGFPSIVLFGVWIREDMRRKPSALKNLLRVYDMLFTGGVEVVAGLTCQEALLEVHRHLGYCVSERLPRVWDGRDAWLVTLTRENYESATGRRVNGATDATQ